MQKENITFIIATFNEEKRIEYPLKNFVGYGKVLVVDNESTDKTREIARKYGATVIRHKNAGWTETEEQMKYTMSHVDTDWICFAAADEIIPKTCLDLYKKIAKEDKYRIVIQNKITVLYEGDADSIIAFINIHFFKKGALLFDKNIMHQRGRFAPDVKPSDILYLPPLPEYSVYHFSLYNTEKSLKTLNTYTNFHSQSVPRSFLVVRLIIRPIWSFIEHYFFGRLFLLGTKGFISAVQFSLYYFFTYAKAYELQHNITLENIERNFQKDKKKLLRSSPKSNIFQKLWANIVIFFVSKLHRWYKFKKSAP
ncbi:glycosyltransferase [Candidatus Woesebacteria bacterium]|nr:glycosyltransferase [Candidatus Woesebacteria bacterium]